MEHVDLVLLFTKRSKSEGQIDTHLIKLVPNLLLLLAITTVTHIILNTPRIFCIFAKIRTKV